MTRTYSQQRYLTAKRSVDDRALNRSVLGAVEAALEPGANILEVGAGVGTMVQRLMEWNVLPAAATYTLVDIDAASIAVARERLPAWAEREGYEVETDGTTLTLEGDETQLTIRTVVDDATQILEASDPDLLIGSAFIDLFRPSEVEALVATVPAGCHCYFPITFDGETVFEPPAIPGFDDHIIERYHEDMIRRKTPGNPKAGRHLLALATGEYTLQAAGSSDWVVTPDGKEYPADEAYFLHHIVDTVETALRDDPAVDWPQLEVWADRRHEQIEATELVYVAHQLDLCFSV